MIDELPDPPDPAIDLPIAFNQKASAYVVAQKKMVPQINQALRLFNGLAAGSAYALPYVFDTATGDADPGPGKLRLSSATQNAATVMRLDLMAGGLDFTSLIDTFDASTSAIKGSIRLTKFGDLTKWLSFNITARTAPSGYRNLTVVCTGGSSPSPFADGDGVLLAFQPNGDRGSTGQSSFTNEIIIRSTQIWTPGPDIVLAQFEVIDGGSSGAITQQDSGFSSGGPGGAWSRSIRAVQPLAPYTITVGAGGTRPPSSTSQPPNPGGASSVAGPGFTTLTSSNGDICVLGGLPVNKSAPGSVADMGGGSLYASNERSGGDGVYIGQGGNGRRTSSSAGYSGADGAVIIRY